MDYLKKTAERPRGFAFNKGREMYWEQARDTRQKASGHKIKCRNNSMLKRFPKSYNTIVAFPPIHTTQTISSQLINVYFRTIL